MYDLAYLKRIAKEPSRNAPDYYGCDCGQDLQEAADEIERLRGEIRKLREEWRTQAALRHVRRAIALGTDSDFYREYEAETKRLCGEE